MNMNNKDFVLVMILSEDFECDHAQVFSSSDLNFTNQKCIIII